MNNIVIPLSFNTRRAPSVQKVSTDGERMYKQARHVIVLDAYGTVIESFQNPPFGETVDCLVVLAPILYRESFIEKAIVLEIGFRRFVPYAQTEYRLTGSTKRGPSVRLKKGDPQNKNAKQAAEKHKVFAIKPRAPVAKLVDKVLIELLPIITSCIQTCVDAIIANWKDSEVIQIRGSVWNSYVYTASVFVRIPEEEEILCVAAYFGETRYRLTGTGTLASGGRLIKKYCKRFILRHKLHKTEQGDFLDTTVKDSWEAQFIASFLSVRILYKSYTEQMVRRMLTLVGKANSAERKLVDQIWRIHKIPAPKKDEVLNDLETRHGTLRRILLSSWKLQNFVSLRHDKKRLVHARNCLTISVLGSHKELTKVMDRRDKKKMEAQSPSVDDIDIPF